MRGCDGHDKVVEVVKALYNVVPLSLMFCLSPWNSFSDMEYVINMAREYNIDVRIGIYGTMDFFDTKADLLAADLSNFIQNIPQIYMIQRKTLILLHCMKNGEMDI